MGGLVSGAGDLNGDGFPDLLITGEDLENLAGPVKNRLIVIYGRKGKLPGMSGVECVRHLKHGLPQAQLMMLTILEDDEQSFQSLRAGATGYLVKQSVSEELLESARDLYRGGSPIEVPDPAFSFSASPLPLFTFPFSSDSLSPFSFT